MWGFFLSLFLYSRISLSPPHPPQNPQTACSLCKSPAFYSQFSSSALNETSRKHTLAQLSLVLTTLCCNGNRALHDILEYHHVDYSRNVIFPNIFANCPPTKRRPNKLTEESVFTLQKPHISFIDEKLQWGELWDGSRLDILGRGGGGAVY